MAEEVSSIGVKLSLNAGSFMTGMTAATEKTEAFVAVAKEAQTVAGRGAGSSGPSSQRAQRPVAVPVDLTVSAAQISRIRKQIIAGIGTIEVPITVQMSKQIQSEAKAIMAAASTPAVGTRSGARVAVESTVARNLPKRAMGGPVYANQGYLVGERRPEVFTPRVSGTIHPDASRFYREEEARARRAASAERQHMDRMRHMGGPVHAMAGAKVGDIEERLTRLQRSYTANIRAASKRLTPEVTKAGVEWYPQAEQWIAEQAKKFGKPEPMVRGMAAALSAGTSWSANKTKLERMLEWDSKGQPQRYSDALDAHRKAKKILAGADPWSILGHTPKTGQFFLNTGGNLDALTIDRWAFRTATRGAVDNQGSGRVRRGSDRAFRRVAKEMGIAPVQLQAALWIQEKYDADVAAGRHADISKYMHGGGFVHAAKGFFMKGDKPVGDMGSGFVGNLTRRYTPKGGTERLVYRGLERSKKMTPEEAIAAIEAHNAGLEAGPATTADPAAGIKKLSSALRHLEGEMAPPAKTRGRRSAKGGDEYIKFGGGFQIKRSELEAQKAELRDWWKNPALIPEDRGSFGHQTGTLQKQLDYFAQGWPSPVSMGYSYLATPPGFFSEEGHQSQERFERDAKAKYGPRGPYKPVMPSRLRHPGMDLGRSPLSDYQTARAAKEQAAIGQQHLGLDVPMREGWNPYNYLESGHYGIEPPPDVAPFLMSETIRARQAAAEAAFAAEQTPAGKRAKAKAEKLAAKRAADSFGAAADDLATSVMGPAKQEAGGHPPGVSGRYDPLHNAKSGTMFHEWRVKKAPKLAWLGDGEGNGWIIAERYGGEGDFDLLGDGGGPNRGVFDTQEEALRHADRLRDLQLKQNGGPPVRYSTLHPEKFADNPALKAQLEAAAGVPKHEAPPVIEHMAVIERHAKKAVEAHAEKVAEAAISSVVQTADTSGRIIGPSLFETTPRPAGGKPMSSSEADAKLRALGLHRRGAGGGVNGMYVVNEMGPEAFIESGDVSKLAANRPDIYSRIPGSHDGMRSGMINRPAWSMFAPHKSGVIVRREDAHAALGAIHAAGGLILPGEEDEARRAAARAAAYGTPPELYLPKGPSYSAATPVSRGVRGEGMEAFAAAIKADAALLMAHAEAAKKGTTLLGTGAERIAGLLEAGPSAIPMGPPTSPPILLGPPGRRGNGVGRINYTTPIGSAWDALDDSIPKSMRGDRGGTPFDPDTFRAWLATLGRGSAAAPAAPAAPGRPRLSHPSGHAYWGTPEGRAEMAGIEGAPAAVTATPVVTRDAGRAAGGMSPEMARAFAAGRSPEAAAARRALAAHLAGGFEAPAGLSKDEQSRVNTGLLAMQSHREALGGASDQETRIEEMRKTVAGVAAYESARNPRGIAAVLGQLGLGGGQAFKEKQAELSSATIAYRKRARAFENAELQYEGRRHAVEATRAAGEEPSDELLKQLQDREAKLGFTRKNLTAATERLEKAEKAVQPTASNVVKSFGAVVLSTSLYGASMQAVNFLIEKAAVPAMGRWIDQMTGWQATATTVTSALGDQLYASHGNIQAVMAQTAVNAGLSKSMLDYVGAATTATATAKAGAKAQQETSGLFRTALRGPGSAPEGLYGGYGGVFGSSFLGSEIGGGKGFTEQVREDLGFLAGGKGKAAADFPIIGNPANAGQNLSTGLDFVTDRDYRDYIDKQGKAQGGGSGAFATTAEIPGGVGDVLGGLGDALSAFNPFGNNFGSTFLGGMKNAQGVPYGGYAAMDIGNVAGEHSAAALGQATFVPQAMTGTAAEQKGVTNYLEDLNSAIDRGADSAKHATVAHYGLAKSDEEVTAATNAAIEAGDKNGIMLAQQGIVLKDNTGKVIDNGRAYEAANEDAARGKTIIPSAVWAGLQTRALQAGQQANAIQSQRTRDVELPFAVTEQLLSNPLIRPGAGFFNARGGAGGVGLSAGAQQAAGGLLRGTAADNAALTAISDQGLAAARKDITQFLTPQDLTTFNQAVTESQGLSASIADITTKMAHMNQEAAKASWANQIRIATRSLGDAIAMEGRAGGTRLGYLQREQHQIDRASQALNLELQQRQITTQIALAGFQAPGETGEERYARQKEKLAEAAIGQKQLGFQKQDYSVAGQEWMIAAHRAAVDAQHAIDVMQKSRDAEGYTAAAQEAIAKKQQLLANSVGKIDSLVGQARGNFSAALSAAVNGVGEFAGSVDQATKDIYAALGYKQDKHGNYYRTSTPQSTGYMGRMAGGYLGGFAGGATFTVGEAGPETVAILRNPRTHMLGGESGGGSPTIHVHVNGPIVREDKDITELARCVAEEVERTLSRKGQLLGLRQPAY